ncbi:MAG: hypothetical protein ACREQ5_07080 [Candidatus Dormibacteria bacterium]
MPKKTQNYRLWILLSTNEPITVEKLVNGLGLKSKVNLPVYIHELKRLFKAEIEAVRDGRKVTAYRLINKIKVPEYRRNNAQYIAKTGSVKSVGETASVGQISDREMSDIRDSLGITYAKIVE